MYCNKLIHCERGNTMIFEVHFSNGDIEALEVAPDRVNDLLEELEDIESVVKVLIK